VRWRALLIPAVVVVLAACDTKELVIQSNTTWDGTITGYGDVAGSGNAVIDLTDAPSNVCWTLKKTTSAGTLRAYLADETWFGLGKEYDGDQTTTEPSGQIEGCNQ
jgi:hypothetical protein